MTLPGRRMFVVALAAAITMEASAQTPTNRAAATPKYSPEVPAKITTPDTVETRIGTLRFKDGAPDPATVQLVYDQLDFGRGIDAFLTKPFGLHELTDVVASWLEDPLAPAHISGLSLN